MLRQRLTFTITGLIACLIAFHGHAADLPPQGSVGITKVTYNGTGCPPGHAAVNISEDMQAMTVAFDQFEVDITKPLDELRPPGQGRPGPIFNPGGINGATRVAKTCTLQITMRMPAGYVYSLSSIDIEGYARFENAVAQLNVSFGFPRVGFLGTSGPGPARYFPMSNTVFSSGFAGDYSKHIEARQNMAHAEAWSACKRGGETSIFVTTQAIASGNSRANAAALLGVDTIDGLATQKMALVWRRCK